MSLPLVTCLCLTMPGRKDFLVRAMECFLSQTYPNKELLMVADSIEQVQEVSTGRFAGSVLEHETRFSALCVGDMDKHLGVRPIRNIGTKRNLGCESAAGDLIAIWDDDDYSAPRRLEQQVEELDLTRKAVTGYHMMKFTDGHNWWSFSCGTGFVIGSSMMFRRDWWEKNRFEEINIGEDVGFCGTAFLAGKLAEVPDLSLMYATIHSGNTSKRKPGIDAGWVPLPGFQWK